MHSSPIPTVSSLDIDSLPEGQISRLFVEIVEDALGMPICVPVLVARGERPGPVLGITAAVHGNELNGIPVIQRLFSRIDIAQLRGTLVGVPVVNVPGFEQRSRASVEAKDLNHIMPGVAHGDGAQVYAFRIIDRIVRSFQYLVDLHTASVGRVNSLYVRADLKQPNTAAMAYLLRPQIALHNPANDKTLRGHAMGLGIPAVTLEIGNPQRFHPEFVKSSVVGLRSLMGELGMLPKRKVAEGEPPQLCRDSRWIYTARGGLLEVLPALTAQVEKGEVIARMTNIFGDLVEEITAPTSGVVIGRSVDPVAHTGARVLHLGRIAEVGTQGFLTRDLALSEARLL